MATFRTLLTKKKGSLRSGAGTDEVFQPIWFAFEIMERFLGTIYDVEETMNTEDKNLQDEPIQSQIDVEIQSQPDVESPLPSQPVPSLSQLLPSPLPAHIRQKKRKASSLIDEAQIKISQSLDTLNQVFKDKKKHTNDEDECNINAILLAKKLRKYPESMRARIMYKIDGLLLGNPCPDNLLSRAGSHYSSSPSPQSQYSGYQIISTPSPVHVIPQTQQPQDVYVMQPTESESSLQLSIPETPHNLSMIERAYWDATQN
ncbi:hypothetical protein EVAR_87172_1 [Eumeta japonica]|uniref:Uncharacterized protein n=1 Tax=Eumeta variegata TaxID=151549 RepID=A0A4C1VV37_EUMVA|nr:hypothetical protein EVAR_87172_1 [Eumeta japonica]